MPDLHDPLAAARGLLLGFSICVVFWAFVGYAIYLVVTGGN